jgi:hypothetical protein
MAPGLIGRFRSFTFNDHIASWVGRSRGTSSVRDAWDCDGSWRSRAKCGPSTARRAACAHRGALLGMTHVGWPTSLYQKSCPRDTPHDDRFVGGRGLHAEPCESGVGATLFHRTPKWAREAGPSALGSDGAIPSRGHSRAGVALGARAADGEVRKRARARGS